MALNPRILESEVPGVSKPGGFDSGSPVIKSIETELHRTTRTCKGLSKPYGACLAGLMFAQVSQLAKYLAIVLRILDHQ